MPCQLDMSALGFELEASEVKKQECAESLLAMAGNRDSSCSGRVQDLGLVILMVLEWSQSPGQGLSMCLLNQFYIVNLGVDPGKKFQAWFFTFHDKIVLFSRSGMSDSLQPHGLQHTRLPCTSLSPGVCSSSCHLSW